MKKIISFAMAAMLVLAFAVPVFAISGVTIPTNPAPTYDAELAITPVQNTPSPNTSGVINVGGQFYPLPANYHVVKDTIVTFVIQYSIPAKGEINYNGYIEEENLALDLKFTNLYEIAVRDMEPEVDFDINQAKGTATFGVVKNSLMPAATINCSIAVK